MSSYTSLALGFFVAIAVGACGSSEDDASNGLPDFSGGIPTTPNGAAGAPAPVGTTPNDTTANASPNSPVTGNEGGPDVTELTPTGAGGTGATNGAGGTGAVNGAGGAGTEPQGTAGTPAVVTEPPPEGPRTQVFLLFGQSNMFGVPPPLAEDLEINPRVEVLTLNGCATQDANQWKPAQPPLHGCVGQPSGGEFGPGLGPGDYFGKAVAVAFPEDTILLVPNAIAGVSIDVFQPGQQAYNSILARARMAQQRGEIRGMIFHQGETDSGQDTWPVRVKTVVDQLRSDLAIGPVPFVAGELPETGCCGGHNAFVAQLPSTIDEAYVVASDGLGILGDGLHFHRDAQKEFGARYGAVMIDALRR
jgi:carbohydrate esterase-like sialic acid-specific acetylesterase